MVVLWIGTRLYSMIDASVNSVDNVKVSQFVETAGALTADNRNIVNPDLTKTPDLTKMAAVVDAVEVPMFAETSGALMADDQNKELPKYDDKTPDTMKTATIMDIKVPKFTKMPSSTTLGQFVHETSERERCSFNIIARGISESSSAAADDRVFISILLAELSLSLLPNTKVLYLSKVISKSL
ncbi:Hypothetical protein CINCED_3A021791 [Cinara cedri]|uniref:Uncharacterized protein n=1 Tax=Cinara cedri TaxID=506608 RepID=A0A5E4MTG8_9HEMI|nr:Hypothetical protein CINCED_3A021791 [Cinara cedri]